MGSSPPFSPPPGADFSAVFQAAAGPAGILSFDRFMALALYHAQIGYYRRARPRVGRAPGTDFFTAASSGPVFGELVAAACTDLLSGLSPRDFAFVEIGAEPGGGVLAGVAHPFGSARTVGAGEEAVLAGPCVVFSNELFDAQPFRRLAFRRGAWRELGVALRDGRLEEVELESVARLWPADAGPTAALPATAPEGYVLDAPLEALALMDRIAAQPWTGLLVACDYGKTWPELIEAAPAGTARAYHRHRQSNDLLAHPGEQDLTCHVCWDWLADALRQRGFGEPRVEFQESFFVRHAAARLSAAIAADAGRFSPRKQALAQLLHPAHLGQKFQVLSAIRGGAGAAPL